MNSIRNATPVSLAAPSKTKSIPRITLPRRQRKKPTWGLNAGHDLNLENLSYFAEHLPGLLEVSIGHALICDALYMGLVASVKAYLNALGYTAS